jgi:cysteine-rich repeat protein
MLDRHAVGTVAPRPVARAAARCLAVVGPLLFVGLVACDPASPPDNGGGGADPVNNAPTAPVISLAPALPVTTDDLSVSIVVPASDDDGDDVTYAYRWLKDGAVLDDLSADTVPAARTQKGETWTAVVLADDGEDQSLPAQASVTIGNALPTATVTFAPVAPTRAAPLQAVTELQDADADAVTATFSWTAEGVPVAQIGDTLPAEGLIRGQTITVRVTPNDGDDDGDVVTASVVVENALPTVERVTIAPEGAITTDVELTANVDGAFDVDGDEVTLTWRWFVDDVEVVDVTGPVLPAFVARKGQTVVVDVTPNDGIAAGVTRASDPVVIADAAPSLVGASIDATEVREASVLSCVLSGFVDVDGDADQSLVRWFVNDVAVAEGAFTTTLTGADFSRGDRVRCEAEPRAGDPALGGALVVSDERTVLNTPPRTAAVSTSPARPTVAATLTAEPAGVVDDDGDTVSLATVWRVGGVQRATGASVAASTFVRGEAVVAVVTPSDGIDAGAPVSSAPVTIENALPTLTSVRIQLAGGQTQATRSAPLSAVAEGIADLDRDSVTVRFAWKRGTAVLAEGTTLSPELFVRGDVITVEAIANDGIADGATVTSTPVTIVDAPPRVAGATIAPANIRELSTVSCASQGFIDDDGDADGSTVRWFVNGTVVASGTAESTTLNGTRFNKGDRIQCELTAHTNTPAVDGNVVVSAVRTVENTPPVLASATPTVTTAKKGDVLDVVTSGAVDDDGDALSFEVAWLVNNVERVRGAPVSANLFNKGESVVAVVRAFDGAARSDAVTTTAVLIVNTAPTLQAARITLPPGVTVATKASNLFGVADGAADVDGDTVTTTFSWRVGPVVVGAGSTLSPGAFRRGDVVTLVAVPGDGEESGQQVTSTPVTIANAPPSAPGLSATPALPADGDDLRCAVTTASTDLDNDVVRYGIAWTRNGATTAFAGTNLLAGAEVAVPASATAIGETWTCTVTADDGNGGTRTATAALTVGCRSMDFNGTTSKVVVSNLPFSDGNAARSISAWTNFSSSPFWDWQDIFALGDGTQTERRFALGVNLGTGELSLAGQDYDIGGVPGWSSLENRWAHWAVTFDGSTAKVFLDGVEVLSGPRSYRTDWTQPLVIGSDTTTRDDEYFAGRIGEVRMWNRGLTADEVRADRNAPPNTTGLVGWWNLAGVDGNGRIADLSGNGRNGVPTAQGFTQDCPVVGPTPLLTKETVTSGRRVVAYPFVRDYAGAEAVCAAQGMRLAVPRNAADNLAMSSILPTNGAWIGVDDRVSEGVFLGSDRAPIGFNNFRSDEPNGGRLENCMIFIPTNMPSSSDAEGRTWADVGCTSDPRWDFLFCEEPCRAAVVDGRTIDFCSEQATYARAEGICAQRGGALVTIPSSSASASLVAAATTALPGLPYWIGLTDRAAEGTFRWSDGGAQGTSPYLFNGFVAGEPNNGGGSDEDCVRAAATTGGWSDVGCATTSAFACDVDAAAPTFVCGNGALEAFESCDDGNNVDGDSCNNQCVPNLTQTAFADFNNGTISPYAFSIGCAGLGCPSVVSGTLKLNGDWNVLTPPASALAGTRFAVEFTVIDPQALKDFGPDQGPRVQNGRLCDITGTVCQTARLPLAGDVWRVESNLQAKTARVLVNGIEVLAISNAGVPTSYTRGVIFGSFTGGRVNGTVDNLRWFSGP